ncbi:MAG: ABC transporter permease [Trueperaceae bacterium]|nr:ABC transporter permease [Trueperaceae bacterium]
MASRNAITDLHSAKSYISNTKENRSGGGPDSSFVALRRYFDIILYQTQVDIKDEASRYFLGLLWWFIDPLMYVLIFSLLHRSGMQLGSPDNHLMKLIVGVSLWRFFAGSLPGAANSIMGNNVLINQVALPKWIFPIQALLLNLVKFFFLLLVVFAYLWSASAPFSIHYLSFPIVFAVYFMITIAFSILVAAVVPFFPDIRNMIGSLVLFLMFTSGVFFSISDLSPDVQHIFYLNPFAVILESFKRVLVDGRWPMWNGLFIIFVSVLPILFLGFRILHRFSHEYPKMQRG